MKSPAPSKTKKLIKEALGNGALRSAVFKATESSALSRQKIIDQIPYWEDLRDKAHLIKKDVIENLSKYLTQFERNCELNGIAVHWASDSAEAQKIILDIAKQNNVTKVVKSKSLTTEEIHLNDFLKANDIESLETDLGEYIVQLNDQIPSHLIIPAMHLSRKDIGELFAKKLGVEYTEDPAQLLLTARKILREKFLAAEMGITGVNFAFAANGSFCVVENEANAHNTLSLPPIHIAVMGLEKIIPDVSMLPYFLKLLPANATGQKSSTYVNFIGGPTGSAYGEGPEQIHIILLDNGRTKILKDPVLRESLYCIRCGACLNACPVYQQIGGHAYGWVYMGPIGSVLIPQFLGEKEGRLSPFLSSLCGACTTVCPTKINLPHHLLTLRSRIVDSGNSKFIERNAIKIWSKLGSNPKAYRLMSRIASFFQSKLFFNSPLRVPGYGKERQFPLIHTDGFRARFLKMNGEKKNG